MTDTYLTAAEAAIRLGVTPSRIRQLCLAGRFPGARNTNPDKPARGEWQIPRVAVEAFRPGVPGRPKRR